MTNPMTDWQPRRTREEDLKTVEARLAALPEGGGTGGDAGDAAAGVEARFHRACLLALLGRSEAAQAAFLDVLGRAPTHFGALNDFGNLLFGLGFRQAARSLYAEAVRHHPDNPTARVNLGNLLVGEGDYAAAQGHFEAALQLAPDSVGAHRGLACLAAERRDDAQAARHREAGFGKQPVITLPYHGDGPPVELLVLVASGGVIPMRHHFDPRVFAVSALFVEHWDPEGGDPAQPLPPHQRVFNSIGDPDLCGPALDAAARIAAQTSAPVLNPPAAVRRTGRAENARALAGIDGVTTPRVALLPRAVLEGPGADDRLAAQGFAFPLLLRAPGFHTGRHFVRVESESGLAGAVAALPGPEVLVIEFLDTRRPDGKTRKYRAMMVGGALYPLHAAVSRDWKIHYFTAEMAEGSADGAAHRAEDAAFLEDMAGSVGPRALRALEGIRRTLGLDYGGIDFGLSAAGEVVLYEANASMVVLPPDPDPRWDYRRPAVGRILAAVRRLLGG